MKYSKSKNKYFNFLDNLDSEDFLACMMGTEKSLVSSIKEILSGDQFNKNNVVVPRLINLYKDYREGSTQNLIQDIKFSPQCLLKSRNQAWMYTINSVLSYYNTPFIAVVVAHDIIDEKG